MQAYEEQDYTKKFELRLWKRLLKLIRPFWGDMLRVALLMMLCALIDNVYPRMTQFAIDQFITPGKLEGIWVFAGIYGALIAVHAVTIYSFIRMTGKVEVGTCHLIRKIGFERLQQLSFSFYDTTPVGFLMARLTSDTQRLGDTVGWAMLDIVWSVFFLIFTAANMLLMNWKLALIALIVLPVLAVVSVYFQRRILKFQRLARKTNSRITSSFNEGIMGAKTTKTLVRESRNIREFEALTEEMRSNAVRASFWSSLYMPIVMSMGAIATGVVIGSGGHSMATGALTMGTLAAFVMLSMQFFEPIREMARVLAEMQSAQAAAERVMSMIETEPEITDAKEITDVYGDQFSPKRENWPEIEGKVEFRDVTFRYKTGEQVLSNFNLTIEAGNTIALVGHTGSGKSTIINLVCRFYEPSEGELLIDGVDYRKRSQLWLQSNLGYVLQSPHLFSGTIRENIRYGRLEATDEEVEEAARLVDAETFILKLEKGYDTDVGEGGNRLSTGEKQLISFARALLANPRIFVLDEATSSIDTETEALIQRAISRVLEGRTSFIVAHRLSTIRSADRILVIDSGKIIEDGSHAELIALKGHYYELYTNQFEEEGVRNVLGIRGGEDEE